MKVLLRCMFLFVLAGALCSVAAHEYYVAVFQVEHVPAKKQLQITARVFIDDLDAELSKKYNKKFYLCTPKEIKEADDYLKQYFAANFKVKVNGSVKPLKFLGRETEDNTLICYLTAEVKGKITSLDIKNTFLFKTHPEQQNIIDTKINSNKKSLLLTNDTPEGRLQF